MARRVQKWTRNIVIEPAEMEAMCEALIERPDTDSVEVDLGHMDSPFTFYYGVRWKTHTDDDDFDFGEDDE